MLTTTKRRPLATLLAALVLAGCAASGTYSAADFEAEARESLFWDCLKERARRDVAHGAVQPSAVGGHSRWCHAYVEKMIP